MKTSDPLLTILRDAGFKPGINTEAGSYCILSDFQTVVVHLGRRSYITVQKIGDKYLVYFYYDYNSSHLISGKHGVFGKQVKKLEMESGENVT